jgi:hypothetical protein
MWARKIGLLTHPLPTHSIFATPQTQLQPLLRIEVVHSSDGELAFSPSCEQAQQGVRQAVQAWTCSMTDFPTFSFALIFADIRTAVPLDDGKWSSSSKSTRMKLHPHVNFFSAWCAGATGSVSANLYSILATDSVLFKTVRRKIFVSAHQHRVHQFYSLAHNAG